MRHPGTFTNSAGGSVTVGLSFGAGRVALAYGIGAHFGTQLTAAFVRVQANGLTRLKLLAGATQRRPGAGMWLEAGVGAHLIGGGEESHAAGLHLGFGGGNEWSSLLFQPMLPMLGDSRSWDVTLAPIVYPDEYCTL